MLKRFRFYKIISGPMWAIHCKTNPVGVCDKKRGVFSKTL
jgi:hypothetical protein